MTTSLVFNEFASPTEVSIRGRYRSLMPCCACCDRDLSDSPRVRVDHQPQNGMSDVQEFYTAYLCPSCLRHHQEVSGWSETLTISDVEEVEQRDDQDDRVEPVADGSGSESI